MCKKFAQISRKSGDSRKFRACEYYLKKKTRGPTLQLGFFTEFLSWGPLLTKNLLKFHARELPVPQIREFFIATKISWSTVVHLHAVCPSVGVVSGAAAIQGNLYLISRKYCYVCHLHTSLALNIRLFHGFDMFYIMSMKGVTAMKDNIWCIWHDCMEPTFNTFDINRLF